MIGYSGKFSHNLWNYKEIIDWTHEHGGMVVANHPLFVSGLVYEFLHHEKKNKSLFNVLDKYENVFAYLKNKGVDFFELNAKTVHPPLTAEIFKTYAIAFKNDLRLTVGSDIHEAPNKLGHNGLLIKKRTFNEVLSSKDPWNTLKKVLFNRNYSLLLNGVDLEALFHNLL